MSFIPLNERGPYSNLPIVKTTSQGSAEEELTALFRSMSIEPNRRSPGAGFTPSPVISSSPYMSNTFHDQILRCIQVLDSNKKNMASRDARSSVEQALEVFLKQASNSLDRWLFEEVQNLLRRPYPNLADLQDKLQEVQSILSELLLENPAQSPRLSDVARRRMPSITESDYDP